MNFLLDTNLLLWSIFDQTRLSAHAISYLLNPASHIAYSPVSIWETGIKHSKHPTTFLVRPERLLWAVRELDYQELNISSEDALAASLLPSIHRDPFDRMLVAQAANRNVILLTADQTLVRYGTHVLQV